MYSDQIQDYLEHLTQQGFSGAFYTDDLHRMLYATDASNYQIKPACVVIPQTLSDVELAVQHAVAVGVPILARGAGSALAGQTTTSGIVLDFTKHLHRILHFDAEKKEITVEPGAVHETVNQFVKPYGLMLGPDPASSNRATLGGMVANNATGTHSILYGSTIDHIVSCKVLLSDGSSATFEALDDQSWEERCKVDGLEGEIYREIDELVTQKAHIIQRDTPRHWRRQGGYRLEKMLDKSQRNLSHLICGSEGTLAILTEITLKLVDLPKTFGIGVVHFESRFEALRSVTAILDTKPSAIELLDFNAIHRCRQVPEFAAKLDFVVGDPQALLIVEYYAENEKDLLQRVDDLEKRLKKSKFGYALTKATEKAKIDHVLDIRKAGLGLVMGIKGDTKPIPFIEDAAVPVEHLATYIEDLMAFMKNELGTDAVLYAHASAGCLHVRPFINTKDSYDVEIMRRIAIKSAEMVKALGGNLSSEHGDGLSRGWLNESFFGKDLYETYRSVKRIFDPYHLLNPGKIVDAPPMTENLRLSPEYRTIDFLTELDFEEDGGFAAAIELCNGAGVCRKLNTGAMCPSYMATMDERHTTRGRANALRAAMSGNLPASSLQSKEMYDTMALCVSCKACKSECPSSVDMAKIKLEWQNQYWKTHKLPLRERIFADMPKIAKWVSNPLFAQIANSIGNHPFVKKRLGIASEREIPSFAHESFKKWFKKHNPSRSPTQVVLFHDTFNTYLDPHIAQAAVLFLERIGFKVVLPPVHTCCGRTYLSKGLIEKAKNTALDTLEALFPLAEAGLPIVGLEPSCILSIRDEYAALFPNDPRLKVLAEKCFTFEEFVAELKGQEMIRHLRWTRDYKKVLIHGHCHQKALVGMEAAKTALSLPDFYEVEVLDTACCGMAGSFGYEAEHYEVSKKMAERRLLPAIEAADENTIIVASGSSCRHQVAHFARKTMLHPAEVLLNALR